MKKFIDILTILIIMILIDCIWLYINKDNFNNLIRSIQGNDINLNYLYALIAYLFMAFGLYFFTINEPDMGKKLTNAAVLGVVLIGVFDFTNASMFDKWNINLAVADTIWGGILLTFTTLIFNKLKN